MTLTEAVALAKANAIGLVLSNPSFEVWLIAHFERVTKWFENGDTAARHLSEAHWRNEFHCSYDKGDDKLYTRLQDRLEDALTNARWLMKDHNEGRACRDANPSTDVYTLIERLCLSPSNTP